MGAVFKMPLAKEKIDRSPRYEVRPGEQQILKFSRGGSHKKICKTRILNISDTGMAFTVDGRAIPHLGEVIKVDFHLESRIIRYGRVVRLESPAESQSNHDIAVAIEFLPERDHPSQKLGLGLSRNLIPIDKIASAATDSSIQHLLLVSGFLLAALMFGLGSF
jgi:hypothetical protein